MKKKLAKSTKVKRAKIIAVKPHPEKINHLLIDAQLEVEHVPLPPDPLPDEPIDFDAIPEVELTGWAKWWKKYIG